MAVHHEGLRGQESMKIMLEEQAKLVPVLIVVSVYRISGQVLNNSRVLHQTCFYIICATSSHDPPDKVS